MNVKNDNRVLGKVLAREQMAAIYGGDIVIETSPRTDEVEEEEEEEEEGIRDFRRHR